MSTFPSSESSYANSSTQRSNGRWINGISYFPKELIDDILLRLPVKSLLRFRCVSKLWRYLIDSTRFIKEHLQRNIECNPDCGLIVRDKENFYLADVDSLEDSSVMKLGDPLNAKISRAEFVGSCNGLVCLWKDDKDVLLWNPATNKCKKLPIPTNMLIPIRLMGSDVVGFGYDCVNDDYKVMRTADSQIRGIEVTIYSLKSDSWTRAETITNRIRLRNRFGVFVNGNLHWPATKDSHMIVAFDLSVALHREMPLPEQIKNADDIQLFVLGGCLGIVDTYPESHLDVWLKKNCGNEDSWTKLLSVEQPHLLISFEIVWPVAFSKTGKDVLLEVNSEKYIWYDLESNEVKDVTVHGLPAQFDSLVYTQSLVQLTDDSKSKRKEMRAFLSKGFKLKL